MSVILFFIVISAPVLEISDKEYPEVSILQPKISSSPSNSRSPDFVIRVRVSCVSKDPTSPSILSTILAKQVTMHTVLRKMLARLMIKHGNQQIMPFRGSEINRKGTRNESRCHLDLSEEPRHVSRSSAQSRITAWEQFARILRLIVNLFS